MELPSAMARVHTTWMEPSCDLSRSPRQGQDHRTHACCFLAVHVLGLSKIDLIPSSPTWLHVALEVHFPFFFYLYVCMRNRVLLGPA